MSSLSDHAMGSTPGNLNIGRCHEDDPFYRYKMPPIMLKQEGRGNGPKTVITNIDAVAAALGREPARLVKHLGKSLGTNAQYKSGVATLRGHLLPATLQESVQDFVDSDVLCGECQNPETVIEIQKGTERRRCKACGYKTV